jgi:hypothetical protein
MPLLRRPAESQGQPAPAGIEPGPLETAEAERARADDQLRADLASEARQGRAEGVAELPPTGLGEVPSLRMYRLLSGQYRMAISVAGQMPIGGENRLVFPDEVSPGMIYIVRAIRVQAPAGARLQLYENNIAPDNFREVVANVQEYSGEPPGLLVLRGPCQLLAVITQTTAVGLAMVRVEGDLVKREPVDT